jgi:hypothetical protein
VELLAEMLLLVLYYLLLVVVVELVLLLRTVWAAELAELVVVVMWLI